MQDLVELFQRDTEDEEFKVFSALKWYKEFIYMFSTSVILIIDDMLR